MPPAPLPWNEAYRLEALRSYEILDTACEANFDSIARLAAWLTACPISLVSLVDQDRQWFKARHGLSMTQTPRDQAFCAHAILDPSRPLVVPDATQDVRFADSELVTGQPDIRFYAGIPLVSPDGFPLGTLCVIDHTPRQLAPDVLNALTVLAQSVTTNLELHRSMRQMQRIALTDGLTGLPNRRAFMEALGQGIARQRRDSQPFSVLYLDLDGFKQINDRHGHATGDRVLAEVASVLRASVRRTDTAARIGGDEFAVVLVGGDGAEASLVGERLRARLEQRMAANNWAVTASVGAISFLTPPNSEEAALALADDLLYHAKALGKNRVLCSDFPAAGSLTSRRQIEATPAITP